MIQGESEEAEKRLLKALALFETLDAQWQIGRCHYDRGELERARGDATAARPHYDLALSAFEAKGATPFVSEVQAAIQSLN